jgi:hypothetical protein
VRRYLFPIGVVTNYQTEKFKTINLFYYLTVLEAGSVKWISLAEINTMHDCVPFWRL